jgi:hypothetical protein
MALNEHMHLNLAQLRELSKHLMRSEQDMEERLTARENQAREAGEDKPDHVRKRLFFLHLGYKRQRQWAEKELATRENAQRGRSFVLDPDATAVTGSKISAGARALQVPAHIRLRTRELTIDGVQDRLHAAWTRMLAALARSLPFVLTARR